MIIVFLLVVITPADSHQANILLRDLYSIWLRLLKLHFEDEIALLLGILCIIFFFLFLVDLAGGDLINFWDINIYKLDWNYHFIGLMSECYLFN